MVDQRPEDELNPPAVEAEAEADGSDREWWDDAAMPWKHKPNRQDIACLAWIGFLGVFSMAMLPLRAWLLGAPERLPWLVGLMGSRTGTAALGSLVRVGTDVPFVLPILFGALMSIKLDWTYWWAGKLWGRGMIEVWSGQSKRAARAYARAERWAEKAGPLGFLVAYIPMPLPLMQVVFVLAGASGMSLKRFLVYDYIASTLWLIAFFLMGWRLGDTAVAVLDAYARIAGYVAIGLIIFIVVTSVLNQRRKAREQQ